MQFVYWLMVSSVHLQSQI